MPKGSVVNNTYIEIIMYTWDNNFMFSLTVLGGQGKGKCM